MTCTDERRRAHAREREFNGIDSIAVSDDRRTLTVILFGEVPEHLGPANFRIEGGRRVTGIEVVDVRPCRDEDPELEDAVCLTVDRPGDLSTYRLCVVEAGPCGEPGTEPHPGFDPRYACAEFTFVRCGDLDCAPDPECPPETVDEPEIDYLAKDYASFRQLMLDRLTLTMPAWTERHVPDIGIALVELLAYEGDRLSYRQDAVATEAYLETARHRISVRRHARLVDYPMHDGCAARAWVCVETEQEMTVEAADLRFVTLPPGVLPDRAAALMATDLDQRGIPPHQTFEPVHHDERIVLRPAHNEIHLWTWGDRECCLPAGTTSATLRDDDRTLRLRPGDVLIFEELRGSRTGAPADADHTHRQAVRLVSVTEAVDALYRQPVLEVTWAREDALTFPLCVNTRGGPKDEDLEIGVARGNVVLVEHGRSIAEPETVDLRRHPRLRFSPVTQSVPFPAPADVARAQARRLLGLPERTRQRLTALWRKLRHDELSEEDRVYLRTLFGAAVLRRLRLEEHPRHAVRTLLARFDGLLEAKLDRLAELVRRARTGYVLDPDDEGWEIGRTWGEDEGEALDPRLPEFRGPATPALRPDPRAALPAVAVTDQCGDRWVPRRDLLDSGPVDRHFVGEVDDDGVLSLRFGDGRDGAAYPPGGNPRARYRVGNGVAGNVGREAITRIVFRTTRQDGIHRVRNPLPARGGTEPEPVAEVRRRAPREVRHRLLRAITAQDYATLAGQVPGVQRAAADLRWTGSWYEAQIAVDPVGTDVAPGWLLDEVRQSMYRYRRIGHDLSVSTATLVPLELELRFEVDPSYVAGHVRGALARVFGSGPGGLFHPDALTFGTPVRVSPLVAAAAAVPGVRHVEVTTLRRLFGGPSDALETGVLPMGPLEVPQLDNDLARPENGLLVLTPGGGR